MTKFPQARGARADVRLAPGLAALAASVAVAGCATTGGTAPSSTTPAGAPAASTAVAAPAGDWRSAGKSDLQEAFVDAASRRDRDGFVEAVVRYEYAQPQPYGRKTFSSARTVYRFDCAGRRIADRENLVYAGPELSGAKVGDATRSTNNLIWRDAAKGTIDGAVLDTVCTKLAR
jgi:hypothetical protein